jgi:hypothetical protein
MTEAASSYLTKEIADGFVPSKSAGWSVVDEASLHPTEPVTDRFVPLDIPDGEVTEILEGLGISAEVVAGGPPTIVTGMGVPIQPTNQRQIIVDDIMTYAYPRYSYHPDVAAHVKQFQSIWALNHGTQGLSLT